MRLILINNNRMTPPIAPIGLEYVAGEARRHGINVEIIDLCLAEDPDWTLASALRSQTPTLVGVSFRNVDDSFWPSAAWFVPELKRTVDRIRSLTDSPICLGGVGFSIFANQLLQNVEADFGIRGDGELSLVSLVQELAGSRRFEQVPGLIWQQERHWRINPPAWPDQWSVTPQRDMVDLPTYFRRGGQVGIETKRGCGRRCTYCADRLAKGPRPRFRSPAEIASEMEWLLARGIDVFHLCDSEFNVPAEHARRVCAELIARGLGRRVRWYAYLAVLPFDAPLARQMRLAGCVGINFTGDAASAAMLASYGQPHRADDLAQAVRHCRDNDIAVMVDLLLGGPGETIQTATETITQMKRIGPDCIGAGLGVRLYPGTPVVAKFSSAGPLETLPGLRRRYSGPIDLVQPTFYISPELGEHPARRVQDLIGGDQRFFEPLDESGEPGKDHNYNDNRPLTDAIAAGARGAYWDILRRR